MAASATMASPTQIAFFVDLLWFASKAERYTHQIIDAPESDWDFVGAYHAVLMPDLSNESRSTISSRLP
jgi:hypothetical protein